MTLQIEKQEPEDCAGDCADENLLSNYFDKMKKEKQAWR
jgi:hypothetical protein